MGAGAISLGELRAQALPVSNGGHSPPGNSAGGAAIRPAVPPGQAQLFSSVGAPLAGAPAASPFPNPALIPAAEVLRQTAIALNLPVDSLSVSLLAFARFFSLTPNPAVLAALRREVLSSQVNNLPARSSPLSQAETASEAASLEAKAMAVAAAFDKGVSLSAEALARYARLMQPPHTEDGESGGGLGADSDGDLGANSGGGSGAGGGRNNREELPNAQELEALAGEPENHDDLLNLLNKIPGKNGQYWAVFPFNITVRAIELTVIFRVLKGESLYAHDNEQVIVDVCGAKKQYRCFLNKNNGKLCADILVFPELSSAALKTLSKRANRFLTKNAALFTSGVSADGKPQGKPKGNPVVFNEVSVQNGGHQSLWFQDYARMSKSSIDEAV